METVWGEKDGQEWLSYLLALAGAAGGEPGRWFRDVFSRFEGTRVARARVGCCGSSFVRRPRNTFIES